MNITSRNLASGLLLLAGEHALAADVRGIVRDESTSAPIAGANVRLVVRDPAGNVDVLVTASSGDDGAYRLDLPAFSGTAAIMAEAPDHAPRNQAGEACLTPLDCARTTTSVGSAPQAVDFRLPRDARVSGRVVDIDDGTHPAYGSVVLRTAGDPARTIEAPVTSDGSFRVVGLHAFSYTLVARVRRSETGPDAYPDTIWPELPCDDVSVLCDDVAGGTIKLSAGYEPPPLDVRVRRGAHVRTRVLGTADNQPLQHSAQLHSAANPRRFAASPWLVDGDGYNVVGPVLPGAFKLLVAPRPASSYYPVLYPGTTCLKYPCDFGGATTINLAAGQLFVADGFHASPVPFIETIFTDSFEPQ